MRRMTKWSQGCVSCTRKRHNNTLHTEPRAARLLETMIFAAARWTLPLSSSDVETRPSVKRRRNAYQSQVFRTKNAKPIWLDHRSDAFCYFHRILDDAVYVVGASSRSIFLWPCLSNWIARYIAGSCYRVLHSTLSGSANVFFRIDHCAVDCWKPLRCLQWMFCVLKFFFIHGIIFKKQNSFLLRF